MSSADPPSTDRARLWRPALVGGAVGIALALPVYWQTGQGAPLLFVAGIVAGYLAPEGVDADAAGSRAGAVAAFPLLVWVLFDSTGAFGSFDSLAFTLAAGTFTAAFVVVFGYLAGGLGAGIGGWLAVQFGRKEPA